MALPVKPILGGVLVVGACIATAYAVHARCETRIEQAETNASEAKGEARAAGWREAEAKDQARMAEQTAEAHRLEAVRLRALLERLPKDPGPKPVSADASVQLVADELATLGVRPGLFLDGLKFTIIDSRTVLGWGREAQRVEPLAGRLAAAMALTTAQEGENTALRLQVEAQHSAIVACDDRASAIQRQADALQVALATERKDKKAMVWKTRLTWGTVAVSTGLLGYLIGGRR